MSSGKRICVYCGSSSGVSPGFTDAAITLGKTLADNGYGLVYGGASIGLMGAVADAALESGGSVIGVMPQSLADKEIAHPHLTELHVTTSMHERKTLMADKSDGFIALPGGLGTLEELFEIWTWAQLGFHQKPVGLLNVEHYYDSLIEFLNQSCDAGFVKPAHRNMLIVETSAAALLTQMANAAPITTAKIAAPDQR